MVSSVELISPSPIAKNCLSVVLPPPHLPVQVELSRASSSRASHYIVIELRSHVHVSVITSLGDVDRFQGVFHQLVNLDLHDVVVGTNLVLRFFLPFTVVRIVNRLRLGTNILHFNS